MLVILRIQRRSERLRLLEWQADGRWPQSGSGMCQRRIPLSPRAICGMPRGASDFMCVSPLSKKALESSERQSEVARQVSGEK